MKVKGCKYIFDWQEDTLYTVLPTNSAPQDGYFALVPADLPLFDYIIRSAGNYTTPTVKAWLEAYINDCKKRPAKDFIHRSREERIAWAEAALKLHLEGWRIFIAENEDGYWFATRKKIT